MSDISADGTSLDQVGLKILFWKIRPYKSLYFVHSEHKLRATLSVYKSFSLLCHKILFRMRTKYTTPASPSPCLSHHTLHSQNIFAAASFQASLTSSQPPKYPEISTMTSLWPVIKYEMLPCEAGMWGCRRCLGVTACVCCNQSSS